MMIQRIAKILSPSCGANATSLSHSRLSLSSPILFRRSIVTTFQYHHHHASHHTYQCPLTALHLTSPRLVSSSSCGYDMKLDYEESIQQIDEIHNGLKIIKIAAVRGLEFNQPQSGNYLTMNLLTNFQKKLEILQGNWTANAIFLCSQSIDLFSVGIHDDDVQTEGLPLFQKIQDIAEMIETYPEKNLFALYDGFVTGTPFGMLLSSSYRLGTSKTILSIDEPTKGQIPLGGLAYKFCQSSPQYGKSVIRYLCCSGAYIDSTTLFELGILTNVTGHKPYLGLQYSETIPVNDTQAVQPPQGEPEYLPDMVEDMHIGEETFEDLSKYDVWNRFLRVPLEVPNLEPELGEAHLKRILSDVEYCFSAPSVDETITRLQSIPHPFARYALENMTKCDPLALEAFYALTDFANAKRIEIESLRELGESKENILKRQRKGFLESLRKEIKITELLLKRQKEAKETGKGWVPSNIPKKSEFDLSSYEALHTAEEEDLELKKPSSLKELAEEENRRQAEEKLENEKLELEIRNLRSALASPSSVSQDFLAEIKLPQSKA